MDRARVDDETALVPAPGELARLTARASARAREDAADAVEVTTASSASAPFANLEDVVTRLMPFHAFAGPEDAGLDDARRRDGATGGGEATSDEGRASKRARQKRVEEIEGDTTTRLSERDVSTSARGGDEDGPKLSREASWPRDVETFARDAAAFVKQARDTLASRQSKGSSASSLDTDERALVERLAWEHGKYLLRTEQVRRQAALHRMVQTETETRLGEAKLSAHAERLAREAAVPLGASSHANP